MAEDFIDEFSKHEVLHVSHLMCDLFDRWIYKHRAVQGHPDLREAAEQLNESLGQFYQLVGDRFGTNFESN